MGKSQKPSRPRRLQPRTAETASSSPAGQVTPGVVQHQIHQGMLDTRVYASPLIHPDDLERYNAIIQNGAERFFQSYLDEQKHRHDMERVRLERGEESRKRGQYSALFVMTLGIVAALVTVLTGHDYRVAIAFVSVPIASVAIALITGAVSGSIERIRKTRILADQLPDPDDQS